MKINNTKSVLAKKNDFLRAPHHLCGQLDWSIGLVKGQAQVRKAQNYKSSIF